MGNVSRVLLFAALVLSLPCCGSRTADMGGDAGDGNGSCEPATLAAGVITTFGPIGLVVDATDAYWTNAGNVFTSNVDNAVLKVPLGGGAVTTLAANPGGPVGIAVDATSVYWTGGTNGVYSGDDDGTVMKAPLGGGEITTLASNQVFPAGIAVDATSVYWFKGGNIDGNYQSALMKVPLDGGATTTLASEQSAVFTPPPQLGLNGANVYWTVPDGTTGGDVLEVPVGGGAVTTLASSEGVTGIAVDATSAYWISGGNVLKASLGGGAITTLASSPSKYGASQVAVDGKNVYWTVTTPNDVGGALLKVPVTGGTVTTIATTETSPGSLALDATSVYWTTRAVVDNDASVRDSPNVTIIAGSVMKACK